MDKIEKKNSIKEKTKKKYCNGPGLIWQTCGSSHAPYQI